MQSGRAVVIAIAALSLGLAVPVLAHGDDGEMDMDTKSSPATGINPATKTFTGFNGEETPLSYFNHSQHTGTLYAHIVLAVLAWCVVLPVACAFSIAKSRFVLPAQLAFHVLNAVGVLTGFIFNHQTPDLYQSNSHHKLGWAISWIAVGWTFLALVKMVSNRLQKVEYEALPSQPISAEAMAQHQRLHDFQAQHEYRWSRDSGQGTERNSSSLFGSSRASPTCESDRPRFPERQTSFPISENDEHDDPNEKHNFLRDTKVDHFVSRIVDRLGRRSLLAVRVLSGILDRVLLTLGFAAICAGIVVYGGVFRGRNLFSGLAHFIKGGIFFWYGLLTLGRWMGCFADFGWAWNIKPTKDIVGRRKARMPSAEFTESAVIFTYGASNVWLEHLAAWGKPWTAQDFEHISITILFFGGGLLGMLIESRKVRSLLNTAILASKQHAPAEVEDSWQSPRTYKFPMNPMPSLVILLLGQMMGGHHQTSMVSTMMHKQWGNLFVGFALARAATYIVLYISPPTSFLPSRPPTELVSAFCLISGGLIFMASNKDHVAQFENSGLDAMFSFTIAMGFTALIMAWAVIVIAIRGWAVQKENKSYFSKHANGVLA